LIEGVALIVRVDHGRKGHFEIVEKGEKVWRRIKGFFGEDLLFLKVS
jgi:hypothetical protein